MADKKITQLPQGTLTSATVFPVVVGGITSQITYQDIQDGFTGGTSGGNSYVRGWEIEQEQGNSINIGKGIGKTKGEVGVGISNESLVVFVDNSIGHA